MRMVQAATQPLWGHYGIKPELGDKNKPGLESSVLVNKIPVTTGDLEVGIRDIT